MATPVSSGALNLSASSAAANPDNSRNAAANGIFNLSFSDLLRGQVQGNFDARTPISPLTDTRPAPTRTAPPPETTRETPRAHGDSPSPASRPQASRPSQEPTRESARTNGTGTPETGQTVKRQTETQDTAPSQQASTETGKPAGSSEKEGASGNTAATGQPLQPQHPLLADATISPDLPATIAVLLNGIAGEIVKDAAGNESGAETLAQDAPTRDMGNSRYPDTAGSNLYARAATLADSTMQTGAGMESDADSGNGSQGTNPDASAMPTGRDSRHPATAATAPSGTNVDPLVRVNATTPDMAINAANAASILLTPREGGDARIAPAGIAANASEISMLNPLRLPTQAGAALPQFTIPSGAGQRAWAEEVGNRVMWMLGRAESRAELILTPPLLGKVEVSIHLNGDQGTAQFLASSQSAREALEQAMPRLRELLAQAGISLGEASVNTSAEGRAQNNENTHRAEIRTPDAHDSGSDGDATAITATNWSKLDNGLVDTFA
ncbi:MAG: flagellar hook-length control protein FliK [Betaproteobacteria bacterium]|nr:flagellar hook-length control protein FliK [Betaproteobacteria bacterium]